MKTQLIIALDYPAAAPALETVRKIGAAGDYYKVGLELFIAEGYRIIPSLKDMGKKVFLDLKIHDIPNTASHAIKSCLQYGTDMVNIHVQGGVEMMKACAEVVKEYGTENGSKPLLIGVTLLTSLDMSHLLQYGVQAEHTTDYVVSLAALAQQAGLDGVVSSVIETPPIKEKAGSAFLTVTPGIRPAGSATGDQKRIVTPEEAVKMGTDYIVVGRPITGNSDPKGAAEQILQSMKI